jgi:hypothetical protein
VLVVAHDDRAHGISLQIERQPKSVAGELDHFALHGVFEAVKACNTVGDTDNRTFVACLGLDIQVFNAILISSLISDGFNVVCIVVFP